jgi:hypothetical protein
MLLDDKSTSVPHLTEKLEEGDGERQVDQSAVLQGLGEEHPEAPEEAGHPRAQRRVLG